jgi:RHH-type proline utilization regulon transcriptional repressor/proline dehydrogenase/delta 1-pyrroline-5-carboxylate dehydrogenase
VFGPVLHVLRYDREDLAALLGQINATGYGLTLGVHTRIDETVAQVVDTAHAGNIYVNRNVVGAVVGVQPFGGEGLSGPGRRPAARSTCCACSRPAPTTTPAPPSPPPEPRRRRRSAVWRWATMRATRPCGRCVAGRWRSSRSRPPTGSRRSTACRAFAGRTLALAPRPDRRGQSLRRGAARSRALPRRPTTATG